MDFESIKLLAAKYKLGIITSDDLQQAVDQALQSGIYSPSLSEIADSTSPIISSVGPMFDVALTELGLDVPTLDDAIYYMVRYLLNNILSGSTKPREGLRLLEKDVYSAANLHEMDMECVGDSHGLQQLIGCYWTYEEVDAQLKREFGEGKVGVFNGYSELDAEALKCAKQWLAEHPRKS